MISRKKNLLISLLFFSFLLRGESNTTEFYVEAQNKKNNTIEKKRNKTIYGRGRLFFTEKIIGERKAKAYFESSLSFDENSKKNEIYQEEYVGLGAGAQISLFSFLTLQVDVKNYLYYLNQQSPSSYETKIGLVFYQEKYFLKEEKISLIIENYGEFFHRFLLDHSSLFCKLFVPLEYSLSDKISLRIGPDLLVRQANNDYLADNNIEYGPKIEVRNFFSSHVSFILNLKQTYGQNLRVSHSRYYDLNAGASLYAVF